MFRHPDLSKVFGVACDALGVRIGGVLSHVSEKLNEAKQ